MPLLLHHVKEPPRPCSYLPDRLASLEHLVLSRVSPADLEQLLCRGWRRFGHVYFRPGCTGCEACVSLRLPLDRFRPTDSQRRARRRCERFEVRLERPTLDEERLALCRAWHQSRQAARGWEPMEVTEDSYRRDFAAPHPAAWELSLRENGELVAVGLCDLTPRAWSAIYFFYHPRIARLSPGVAEVVLSAELARARGLAHLYLGYRVMDCPSMRYKAAFGPHELLVGRPRFDEAPVWVSG